MTRRVGAKAGGQPVAITGKVTWPRGAKEPQLDLALKGENLPFVRQTGLLLRGDLDLKMRTDEGGTTRVSGAVKLRDSLFLADVRSFIPGSGGRSAPLRRPPFFSVEQEPFNAWTLDVALTGPRFLRIRTPVFTGTASARFQLGGTLGDPRVTGEATVENGQVLLPFALMKVEQGTVRILASDPFEMRLMFAATGRRYGYDLRLDITGTANSPTILFSSSPALESEQVLLMVMAGEAPQNEVNYTGRQRATRLGAYVGQSLLGQLGADPTTAENFSLTVGERVSEQGRETYGLEYMLNERWSLVGEYDEFDDYNVGVKWRALRGEAARKRESLKAKEEEDAAVEASVERKKAREEKAAASGDGNGGRN